MRTRIAALCLALASAMSISAPAQSGAKENRVTHHAKGTFDVKVTPKPLDGLVADDALGRYTIDKQLHGDLEATSKGQMLTGMGTVKTSGGYVAIERVTGTLSGRSGSFLLQHGGTMSGGKQQLTITVVPDSGSGQLTGISGTFNINVVDGKHWYDFDYTLPQ